MVFLVGGDSVLKGSSGLAQSTFEDSLMGLDPCSTSLRFTGSLCGLLLGFLGWVVLVVQWFYLVWALVVLLSVSVTFKLVSVFIMFFGVTTTHRFWTFIGFNYGVV